MSFQDRQELKRQQEIARRLRLRRESPTPLDAFVWSVLRSGYARVIGKLTGQNVATFTESQLTTMLEPFLDDMDRDAFALSEAIERTHAEGARDALSRLRGMPGVDSEMLDQTLDYVLSPPGGQG